jgi:hypothetical protein
MTHSLHRQGTINDLEHDYCILLQTSKANEQGSGPKISAFLELCKKNNAVNLGIMEAGSILNIGYKKVLDTVADGTSVQAVFAEQDDVINMLQDLAAANLGISVVVQGLIQRTEECCEQAGLKPHTWNNSLGVWGRTDLLPEPDILSITTMCGHGLIAVSLINKVVDQVRLGKYSIDDAVRTISGPCICGMTNPVRIEMVIQRLLAA